MSMATEEDKTIWKIYKTTCLVNGKVYIGQSIRTGVNFKYYYGSGKIIKKAFDKHGKENFVRQIIMTCYNQDEANEYEALFIELYSSTVIGIGYNILKSSWNDLVRRSNEQSQVKGTKTRNQTKESKERQARLASIRLSGRKRTEDTKQRMRESAKGRKMCDEARVLKSIETSGKGNPNYGKKHSPETLAKMSAKTSREKHPKARKIQCYHPISGITIKEFNLIIDAKAWLGIGNISLCLRGKFPTAGGKYWRYSENK